MKNKGALFRLYTRVIAARALRCFRISSRVSLLTLWPTLFGPVLLGQASALRVRGREAICLWDLSAAFHQAGHHAGAPETDGPSFDALYQGEARQGVGSSHLRDGGFPERIRERGPAPAATLVATEAEAASTAVACRFVVESLSLPRVISISLLVLRTSSMKKWATLRCQVTSLLRFIPFESLVARSKFKIHIYTSWRFFRAIDHRYLHSMGVDAILLCSTESK